MFQRLSAALIVQSRLFIQKENIMLAKKKPQIVKFGNVEGEFRGSNPEKLINPPLEVTDNYFWLRDDKRENPDVLAHIKQENEYTDTVLAPHQELRKELYAEIKSYIRESYDTYAYTTGDPSPFTYFRRYVEGKDYELFCRRNAETNEVEVLLDINALAVGKKQCDVSSMKMSPDHKYFSYGVDYNGSEKYEFHYINLETKEEVSSHPIPPLAYCDYDWLDANHLYYSVGDERNRMCEVWVYDLTSNLTTLVYKETNEELHVSFEISEDHNYVFLSIGDYDSNYYRFIDVRKSLTTSEEFIPLIKDTKYRLAQNNDIFYILTNKDNSTNWKICTTTLEQRHDHNQWNTFIPHDLNVFINGLHMFNDYFLFKTKVNGNLYINVYHFNTDKITVIGNLSFTHYTRQEYLALNHSNTISNEVYTIDYGYNNIFNTNILNVRYTSMISPSKLYNINLSTWEKEMVYEQAVPNYNEEKYECQRIWVPQEGTRLGIPVSIVYNKSLFKRDGSMPLFLYGYGSYGHTVTADFDYKILPLLDRGYLYAIAHVRGGSFLGYDWYLSGKMKTKLNTFNDFNRVAEYMIDEQYTSIKKIVAEGRSAGGLLIGATVTMKPHLFQTVLPIVPFVDVMNTMSDSKIPLTIEEWTQWGNPNEQDDHDYIKQYCPYSNIKENVDYPHMYITGGLHDPRVPYWEPLKFLAKVRELKSDNNVQVVRMETEQGHFGGSSRYKFIDELSELYTFVFTRK
eukprot:gene10499-11429_t